MTSVASFLAGLAPALPWVLLGVALVIVLLLAWVVLTLRRARAGAAAPAPAGPAAGGGGGVSSLLHLRRSFARGVKTLGEYVPGRDFRYRIPWVLVLGESDSGKSAAVDAVGLDRPFAVPADPSGAEAGVRWAFFNEGVLLDVPGDLLLRPAGGSDEAGWKMLLRLLQEHRTERPLDGVVLAVPAGDLVGPAKLGREALVAKAEAAFAKLWEAQKTLGMRFPVWVLVTQCDRVPGFRGVCSRLPAPLRDEVFGWSSPYPVDTAFAPEWVDQAFDVTHAGLYETQVELLSGGEDGGDADAVFRFPGELRQAAAPLRTYLAEVFQKSVYHESFFFRGLYFTGDENADAPDPFAAAAEGVPHAEAAPAGPRHPVFLKDLFRGKVFPEGGLARPLPQTLRTRGRAVRWAQAAMLAIGVVGGASLYFAHGRLHARSAELQKTLGGIHSRLEAVHSKQGHGTGRARRVPWESMGVSSLVRDMAAVRVAHLWSPAMPTSWFSGIRTEMEGAMTAAFSEVVLPAARDALLQKADSLLPADGVVPSAFIGEGAGADELYRYVGALRDLNVNVRRFNAMSSRDSADVGEMAKLVGYAFNTDPPMVRGERHPFYEKALAAATSHPLEGPGRNQRALARGDTLVRRVYDDLIARLNRLGERSRSVAQARFASGDGLDGFRVLNEDITGVQGFFADDEAYWLDEGAALGPALRAVLDSIPDTPFLSGREFRDGFTERFRDARSQKLLGLEEEIRSYGEGLMSLAPAYEGGDTSAAPRGALVLRNALRVLQQQSFYGSDPAVSLRASAPPGAYVTWDPAYLDRALSYHADYERFVQTAFKDLPVGSQAFVRGLATVQLEARMARSVAQGVAAAPIGQSFGDRGAARELRDRITASRAAAGRVVRLLGIFRALGMDERYRELAGTLLAQDDALLREADLMLERSGLYAPRGGDFEWWNGHRPVAPAAFAVSDAQGVDEYLGGQRVRLQQLLDAFAAPVLADLEAEPLRDFIAGGDADEFVSAARVAKWRAIGAQLDAYEAKTPGNSLAALEQFVREEMNAVEVGGCSAAGRGRADDFFLAARERLRASLMARCQGLARSAASSGYERLREQFQRTLAGRFPFAARDDGETAEAGPEAVRDFFRAWDETGAARRAVAAGAGGVGGEGSPAAEWLEQMERVRGFLAPLLSDSLTGPPYAVAAEFRANRGREAGADQIAAWSLDLGGFRLTPWDSAGSVVPWEPGAPARLGLRWATESALRPAPAGLRGARVQDRTVTWAYGGEWALLRLLRQNAAPPAELGGSAGRARQTLRFQVATLRGAPGDTLAGPAARVYVRLRLLHPDTREELAVPQFPSAAPFMRAQRGGRSD